MNYRHSYHAGNFADVFKHIVLTILLQSFLRKDTAFCYLETHAGIGCYDLLDVTTQKKCEFLNGIKKVLAASHPPLFIQDYLNCVKKLNPSGGLHFYPGSPYFAKCFMRPQDKIILSELHSEDFATLKKYFARDKQIAVHHQDGYQSLKALLPPKERRGLILIDPPYEQPDELMSLPAILAQALKRFETGVYALWYPIKARAQVERFYREIAAKIKHSYFFRELCIYPDDNAMQLNGSGMLVVNPPWQVEEQLENILPWLKEVLKN